MAKTKVVVEFKLHGDIVGGHLLREVLKESTLTYNTYLSLTRGWSEEQGQ